MSKNKRKILFIGSDFWPKVGGVANYNYNLCKGISTDVALLIDEESVKNNILNVEYRKLFSKFFYPRWVKAVYQIYKIAKKYRVEYLWSENILPLGTATMIVAKLLKLPYVVNIYGMDILQAQSSRRKKIISQLVLESATKIISCSKATKNLITNRGIDKSKVEVVYPGVSVEDKKVYDSNLKQELIDKYNLAGKKILLSIGRLVERKGFLEVIEMMPKLLKKMPDLIYVLIGSGEQKDKIVQRIKELNLSDKIIFLDGVNDKEKWTWLELSNSFIMLAKQTEEDIEGFGIVYLEAGLAGKPVIANKCGGPSEAVIDGQTGILLDPNSDLSKRINIISDFLQDDSSLRELGLQAQSIVIKKFNWQNSINKLKSVFKLK